MCVAGKNTGAMRDWAMSTKVHTCRFRWRATSISGLWPDTLSATRCAPGKGIGPLLTSRVPQPDTFPGGGIPYEDARALEFVACMAGQPEIPLDGPTSLGFGNEMLDAQTKACDALGCPAISAPMTGHPGYALAQGAWHASFAGHGQGPSGSGPHAPGTSAGGPRKTAGA